jgi:hypothetical protein
MKKKKTIKRQIIKHKKSGLTTVRIVIYSFLSVCAFLVIGALLLSPKNEKITICANSVYCIKDLSGNFDPSATKGEFMGKSVPVKNTIAVGPKQKEFILGDSTVEKRIYVDLTNQMLYANEGDKTVFSFPVSTGKWGPTPTGTFHIWIKLRYTRMAGGNPALGTYYNLPNVPYTMYFANNDVPKSMGYSIHGAYWHNNFGHPMSHGCVNMRTEDVAKIYDWARPQTMGSVTYPTKDDPGTEIVIYGAPPSTEVAYR